MLPFTRARTRLGTPTSPRLRAIAALLATGLAAGLVTLAATPAAAAVSTYTGPGFTVPDSGAANPSPVTVQVPAGLGVLRSLTLTLTSPAHRHPQDMDFHLRSPSGVQVQIECGQSRTTFHDGSTCNPLDPFYGTDPAGRWELYPIDTYGVADDPDTTYGGFTLTLVTAYLPMVTAGPADVTVEEGEPASFTATATAEPAVRIQWQVSTDGGSTFSDITGANQSTYTVAATSRTQHLNEYRAVFTDSVGTATSSAAVLRVQLAPEVTQEPADVVIGSGGNATFTAGAEGRPSPTVQWQVSHDDTATFADIAGATSPTLALDGRAFADSGARYRAVFTNDVASTPTRAALLTVQPTLPVVTTDISDQEVLAGTEVTFTAAATGDPAPTVQWWVSTDDGETFTEIDGATADSYTVTATAADDGNQYRAAYVNVGGTVSTSVATLTVNVAPVITVAPTDQSAVVGSHATFTSHATGQPAPSVQWQVSTDGGLTFSDIAGATTSTLSVLAHDDANGDRFRAVHTNAGGQAITGTGTLTVLPVPVAPVAAAPTATEAAIAATGANSGVLALAALLTIVAGVAAAALGRRRTTA
ncbi:immunoglobulin domain-containing protein [Cellulomonas fengjieae]|uniref:Ig-like domain-containing protein n=1 Tax=Cellulomonas fengjieae TaxID=2819978 RepID=A0ABS3SCJ1_9CELL|nr:immunoglobulin domain-containing protein [Cellulomonas fengjieae]MBO3083044.1 hypothetical protein [Cellulomonas fengjieae]QVI65584.1 hypothetical protein KG102_16045 [Cellulomonas fengjieae]